MGCLALGGMDGLPILAVVVRPVHQARAIVGFVARCVRVRRANPVFLSFRDVFRANVGPAPQKLGRLERL